ncbi:DUF4347 domain-containing protein [Spirulina sp. 06S082]|uniref:DUF4347 domain-containing protein n=1 Tax=Spirulina sp. 06S082 TaxID=3110248 RepID=UPI002B2075F1|nr:DUF4347 domain-containing protein [Spirulina sp. 06S082]MEA5471836.1 DUF4347 domain-containing protein [Spirulina sp. 06S082]
MNYSNQVSSISQENILTPQGRGMLVIIDPSIADFQHLATGVIAGATVLQLDPNRDGVLQIGDYLRQNQGFTSLHLICHGSPGSLYLGSTKLSLANLEQYVPILQQWGTGREGDRDILLYGCQVAKTAQGREFVKALSTITSAKIAASLNLTGNAALEGNWQLDYQTGEIKSDLAFEPEVMATYPAVLINIANGDVQGLIDAINAANEGGDSTINLASNGTYELLSHTGPFNTPSDGPDLNRGWSGLPAILTKIIINGNDSIIRSSSSASEAFRLIYVDGTTSQSKSTMGDLTLNDITLENGNANLEIVGGVATVGGDDGGAIFNDRGKVTINNSTIRNNEALDEGGAIANFNGEVTINGSTINGNKSLGTTADGGVVENDGANAKLIINSSTLSGNQGDQGGAIRNRNGGTVEVNNSTLTQNTGISGGGGIFNDSSGGSFTVKNSIIAGNTGGGSGPDVVGAITGNSNNLIGNTSGTSGSIGTGSDIVDNRAIDQILNTTLAANGLLERDPFTHALVTGSPAIDAGNGFNLDQRGAVAIGVPDIGAYEIGAQSSSEVRDSGSIVIPDDTGSIDFGATSQGTTLQRTFTIASTGTLSLSLGSLTLPTGFSLVGGFPNSIAATNDPNTPQTQTFTVQLDASSAGTFTGDLSFQTNDTNNNPYNFALTGTVTKPLIIQVLDGNGNLITDDTGSFDFGTTNKDTAVEFTFKLSNPRTEAVTLSNLTLPDGFKLVGSFPTTIAGTSDPNNPTEATFTIQLDATTLGSYQGDISFQTNDTEINNPYNFNIKGTVFDPNVKLQVFSTDRTFIPDDTGIFQFGGTTKDNPVAIAFTLRNISSDTISLSDFMLPNGFSLMGDFPATIAPNSDITFTVKLDALAQGDYTGELSFLTSDTSLTDSIYNFSLGGNVSQITIPDTPGTDSPGTDSPGSIFSDRLQVNSSLKRFTTGSQGGGNLKFQLSDDASDRITQISIVYQNANGDRTLTDVLFTALPSRFRPNGFNASRQTFILEKIPSNQNFAIELQTIDGEILTQEVSFTEVATGRFQVKFTEGISVFLEQTNEGTPLGVGSIQKQGKELLDLRSISGFVSSSFKVYREANFSNTVGFFLASDENGTVNGLAPGDAGYAAAAINNRLTDIELSVFNQGIGEFSHGFAAGSLLVPFMIMNGTPDQFLLENNTNNINNDIIAYFPFLGANPDKVDHIRLLANNTFGFEDLVNGGDNDFNDLIVEVNITQV